MGGRLGYGNPRVDVNLSIHCETVLFSFGGAGESHTVCKFHIGFIRYHRIAMVNAELTIFSSCTIAISVYTKELEFHHVIENSLFIYKKRKIIIFAQNSHRNRYMNKNKQISECIQSYEEVQPLMELVATEKRELNATYILSL